MSVEQDGQNNANKKLFTGLSEQEEALLISEITSKVKSSPNFVINGNFEGAHILSASQFTKEDLRSIFNGTYTLIDMSRKNDLSRLKLCEGVIMIPLFYEPSSRTDLSLNSAMQDLGGIISAPANGIHYSSTYKGENFPDTIMTCGCYGKIIGCRHPIPGSSYVAAYYLDRLEQKINKKVSFISGGDGIGEHPTQALLDLFTIEDLKGRNLDGLEITYVGDLKNGRTVHSNLILLSEFAPNCHINLVSPESLRTPDELLQMLQSKNVSYTETNVFSDVSRKSDIVYWTRIQKERFLKEDGTTDMEAYLAVKDSFIFKAKLFSQMKKDVDLMHPLPRADEWGNQYDHDEIDENPNTAIYRQMFNGKAVRQSTIVHVNGNASKIA